MKNPDLPYALALERQKALLHEADLRRLAKAGAPACVSVAVCLVRRIAAVVLRRRRAASATRPAASADPCHLGC